jgi:HEAT repeat protein
MDKTLEQVINLVEKGNVEQRCASVLVLGALKSQNPQIIKAVGTALEHSNPVLKDYALRYLEEVQPKTGIPLFLKYLDDSDKDIQERMVRLLSRVGPSTVQPLLQKVATAPRSWQLNAARVLCAVRGKPALKGLLQMLAAGTDDFNKAVCDLMTPALREMDAKEQDVLFDEIESFAASLDLKQQRPAVISAIRLLGQLGRPESRRWLCRFLAPEHHPSLRSHALVALLRCLRDQDLRKDESGKLFSLLEEKEFSEVTRLALELLDLHSLSEESRPVLSRLLESPHESVQKFALRKMGDFNAPAIVRTLVEQLGDPDYARRDIAARSLHKIPEARATLIKELLVCDNPSKAWTIAELLPSYEGRWRQDTLDAMWKRLQAAIAAEERIQSAFMHVLKSANPDYLYEQLAAQAARLIKGKKYKESIAFLTPLKESSQMKPEEKFRLALAQLKAHSRGVTVGSQRHNLVIELLGDLYRSSAFPLFEALKKERALTPDELFYLGFTLVERPGEERALGKDLLQHIVVRSPRTKLGKSAKNKLNLINW